MTTATVPPRLIGVFVGLGVLGFGGLLLATGDVTPVWLFCGAVVAAAAVVAFFLAPQSYRYRLQGVVAFGGAAVVLWVVFELQPPLGTYASGSLGVVIGAAVGWLLGRQL